MKLVQNTVPTPFNATRRPIARWTRAKLVPRRTLPTLEPVPAGGGLLERLAGLLGWR